MKKLVLIFCLSLIYLKSIGLENPIKKTIYYDNCCVKEIQYYDSNKNRTGIWESYNENGVKTAEASFKNNKKHGIWKIYTDNKLTMILEYKNGKRIKAFMYNEKEGLIASIQ